MTTATTGLADFMPAYWSRAAVDGKRRLVTEQRFGAVKNLGTTNPSD